MAVKTKEPDPVKTYFNQTGISKLSMQIMRVLKAEPGLTILAIAHRLKWRSFRQERLETELGRLRRVGVLEAGDDGRFSLRGEVSPDVWSEIDRRSAAWATDLV